MLNNSKLWLTQWILVRPISKTRTSAKFSLRRGQAPILIHNIKTCFQVLLKAIHKYINSRIQFMERMHLPHLLLLNQVQIRELKKRMEFHHLKIAPKLHHKPLPSPPWEARALQQPLQVLPHHHNSGLLLNQQRLPPLLPLPLVPTGPRLNSRPNQKFLSFVASTSAYF